MFLPFILGVKIVRKGRSRSRYVYLKNCFITTTACHVKTQDGKEYRVPVNRTLYENYRRNIRQKPYMTVNKLVRPPLKTKMMFFGHTTLELPEQSEVGDSDDTQVLPHPRHCQRIWGQTPLESTHTMDTHVHGRTYTHTKGTNLNGIFMSMKDP